MDGGETLAMGMQKRSLGLAGDIIPRAQQRLIDQRCEERHEGWSSAPSSVSATRIIWCPSSTSPHAAR
jgi:hypothetical protein